MNEAPANPTSTRATAAGMFGRQLPTCVTSDRSPICIDPMSDGYSAQQFVEFGERARSSTYDTFANLENFGHGRQWDLQRTQGFFDSPFHRCRDNCHRALWSIGAYRPGHANDDSEPHGVSHAMNRSATEDANAGGAIQVVTQPGGVGWLWYRMP